MRICKRCGSGKCITEHHVLPVVFFGRKGNTLKRLLCWHCHQDIVEKYILSVESFVGRVPFGRRFELAKEQYCDIAKHLNIL